MMKSHLTAISRKQLPVPIRWLVTNQLIHGHVLDYGCGKCKHLNENVLSAYPGVKTVTSYDPYYEPHAITTSGHKLWDVVLCTYVLCTLEVGFELPILKDVQSRLLPNGVAYVSVRNDKPKGGYGTSSKGTFQRKVEMPYLYELRRNSQYSIYLLTSSTELV